MGMRKKTVTTDCAACDKMFVNDSNNMTCSWGQAVKVLLPQKGKKPRKCNLKRAD